MNNLTKFMLFLSVMFIGIYLFFRKAVVPVTLIIIIYMTVWHVIPQLILISRHI